jgi:DNA helicase II / ATP-dependent DNA helicase PcrA
MSSYLNELNETQRQAATHIEGPALVIAVPGAGKTRVLTYRIAHLLEQGVPPDSILALTFTNKAAKEMKERISKIASSGANQIWAGTFHSIFARILRTEAPLIDFPSDFSIYDTTDAKSVLSEIVRSQNLDTKTYTPSALYFRISNAKNNLISPELYRSNNDYLVADKNKEIPYAYKIYDLYVRKCQRAGAMDFDDLLYLMHELLRRNPENVLEKYRHKFKYILVDEFQDTNPLQYAIIQYLVKYPGSKNNIFAVGDDAQSIYGFRGATIQNILDFEKDYPTMKIFKLEQNYRSTNHIVQAANNVISHNKRQFKKNIRSEKSEGRPIKVIRAVTDKEEAKYIAESIIEQRHRFQLKYEDMAILYRTNAQSRVFEEALNGYRIPYKIYGGMSFYERKEIKDVLAYLRVVVNPKDEEAIKRVINYPTRGIGDSTVSALIEEAEKRSVSLWDMLKKSHEVGNLTSRAVPHIRNFVLLIETFRLELVNKNAYELAQYIVKHTGILDELKAEKTSEAQERVDNVQELLDAIKSFVDNDEIMENETSISDKNLSTYLQNAILQTDTDKNDPNANDKVKLMSVHAAKGLEFPAVFVVGMEENLFPSMMALKSENAREGLDEERRLFYVAITRAENFLTLSYASSRYRFGKVTYNNSSRFIDEIEPQWLELSASARQNTSASTSSIRGKGIPPAQTNAVNNYSKTTAPANIPTNFKPSPNNKITAGLTVLHERFGQGKIISTEGEMDNKVATILFSDGVGEKRIMLRFAKLMIIA